MGLPAVARKAPVVEKSLAFNPNTFLAIIGEGRKNLSFAGKQAIFAQGTQPMRLSTSKKAK